eukprot:TRINITY_DN1937_c0_g1_i2.p1 TRINITY_DN1937_c0_g1~~TRINITY_DN1937_c0_g1_i2.p1  ORF type:complete len:131 (-),score=16.02 TRINITY_DN1937_c0_g1_i2:50-442(-)
MLEHKVDVVVVLNEAEEIMRYLNKDMITEYGNHGMAVLHLPICDFGVPETPHGVLKIVRSIKKFLDHGLNVLVHCHAGIGRTGLVLAAFTKSYINTGSQGPIEWLRETIVGAVQTPEQRAFIESWNFSEK